MSLALALAGGACVSLRPFSEVRRAQPAARYVSVDGHAIYVEQQGDSSDRDDAVVLLHGFGASSYSWRHMVPELAQSFRVVVPDLYGFGWTERPRELAAYTRSGQANLVLGVLRALGIRHAQVVGHSYGGSIAVYLATHHPEIVRSLVLVDSAAPTYPTDRRSNLARFRLLDRLLMQLALRPDRVRHGLTDSIHDRSRITPDLVQAYLDRLRVEGELNAFVGLTAPLPRRAPGQGEGYEGDGLVAVPATASTAERQDAELALVHQPALAIWGSEDHVVPLEDGRRGASRLPHGSFVVLPGAGHLPMEDQPEGLVRLIEPFLAAHRDG